MEQPSESDASADYGVEGLHVGWGRAGGPRGAATDDGTPGQPAATPDVTAPLSTQSRGDVTHKHAQNTKFGAPFHYTVSAV